MQPGKTNSDDPCQATEWKPKLSTLLSWRKFLLLAFNSTIGIRNIGVQASFAIFRPQRSWVKSRSDPLPPLGIDKTYPGEQQQRPWGKNSTASILYKYLSNTLRTTLISIPEFNWTCDMQQASFKSSLSYSFKACWQATIASASQSSLCLPSTSVAQYSCTLHTNSPFERWLPRTVHAAIQRRKASWWLVHSSHADANM